MTMNRDHTANGCKVSYIIYCGESFFNKGLPSYN